MDKMTVAAALDRIIYDDPETFRKEDAEFLRDIIPIQRKRWFGASISAKMPGGTTSGHAAGIGNVEMKDDGKEFNAEYGTDQCIRVGQYKLSRDSEGIQIWQMMTDQSDDEPKGALLAFTQFGMPAELMVFAPYRMRIPLLVGSISFQRQGWKPWKVVV